LALAAFYAVHARDVPVSQRLLVELLDFAILRSILFFFQMRGYRALFAWSQAQRSSGAFGILRSRGVLNRHLQFFDSTAALPLAVTSGRDALM
jgi:hypothetical protein